VARTAVLLTALVMAAVAIVLAAWWWIAGSGGPSQRALAFQVEGDCRAPLVVEGATGIPAADHPLPAEDALALADASGTPVPVTAQVGTAVQVAATCSSGAVTCRILDAGGAVLVEDRDDGPRSASVSCLVEKV